MWRYKSKIKDQKPDDPKVNLIFVKTMTLLSGTVQVCATELSCMLINTRTEIQTRADMMLATAAHASGVDFGTVTLALVSNHYR